MRRGPLRAFVEHVHGMRPAVLRPHGTAVFLNPGKETTPLALRANVEHDGVLHRDVVILSVETPRVPHVPEDERVVVDDLGYAHDGIAHVTARFGFQDEVDVPRTLRLARKRGLDGAVDLEHASYFLSRMTITRTRAPGMRPWRKRLFLVLARNASNPVAYFGLPDDRTVVMGSHVDV